MCGGIAVAGVFKRTARKEQHVSVTHHDLGPEEELMLLNVPPSLIASQQKGVGEKPA